MEMLAAIMTRTGHPLTVERVHLDAPKANEVVVRIKATGICHSDWNALQDPTTPVPTILGHEGAGEVVEVGDNVSRIKVGDKVALNWVPFCGTCEFCSAGHVNLCESAFGPMFAGTLLDGTTRLNWEGEPVNHYSLLSTFAEYAVVPEMSCVKMPQEMPLAQAALIGCGVATGFGASIRAARVTPGSSVAIFGIGGVGVNAIQGARLAGAATIIACDVKQQNLDAAAFYGATHCVNVAEPGAVDVVKAITGGKGVHFAIDCTGNTNATSIAWRSTRKGGTIVVVGAFHPQSNLTLPAGGFHRDGKTLKGSFYGDVHPFRDFPLIAEMYLRGNLHLDELILDHIALGNINEAFDKFSDQSSLNVGRVVVDF